MLAILSFFLSRLLPGLSGHGNHDGGTRLLVLGTTRVPCPDMEKVLSDTPNHVQCNGEWEEGPSSAGHVLSTLVDKGRLQ